MDSSGEEWDEDVETQLAIELSLLGLTKPEDCGGVAIEPEDCGGVAIERKSSVPDVTTNTDRIFTAIRTGDVETLVGLCDRSEAWAQTDSRGWSPLHEAAVQSSRNVLQITFSATPQGAGLGRTLRGETPLHLAAERGLTANATFLLQNGSDPNTPNQEEDSPLISAIKSDQYDTASLLLSFGAEVNGAGQQGRTALHEAAVLGRENLVLLLLQAGASPDPLCAYNRTPLCLAAQNAHLDVLQTLLQRGARVNSQALDSASVLFEAAASGDPDIITLLLESGADGNLPNHTGHLPIHRAAHRGHLLALERLIPVTSPKAVLESGMSPLHSAAAGGHPQCIELLLNAGYEPNHMLHPRVRRSYDDERRSALYFAVSNGDMQSCRLLLEAGAMPNRDPVTCLQVALRLGNYELIHTLLRHGADANYRPRVNPTHFPSALQGALRDPVLLRMLLNHGCRAQRCFHCPYGDGSHVPHGYEGWGDATISNMLFCEFITISWLKALAAPVVLILLDYVGQVTFCSKLRAVLEGQKEWPEISLIQGSARSLKHLCRLAIRDCLDRHRFRGPVFISLLPLPTILKDYILFREYDLYGQGRVD